MARQYVTTAIDYPNAAPHMGHVLEKVLADVTARWFRLRGDAVRFQIGTDEHGIKIQQTAEKEGISPKQLVDRNTPLFRTLYDTLQISYDHFIRTSDQHEHWPTVIELWMRLRNTKMLEKKSYTGLYCAGCERFMTKRDLVDGKCPNHQVAPEEVKEENWFYLLSKDSEDLRQLLTKQWDGEEYRIVPEFRAQETLSLIEQGLEDISFSRPTTSLSWGVPVPDDEEQTMYVWCDALTNYISGLGYFTDHEQNEFWDSAEITHVIGKDIARFHALYWPSMLKHAGVRIPDRLLIHGFLTSEGEKMSKSLGNVVIPSDVIEKYGVDPLRFYLSHEIPLGRDGDFSWKRFAELYDAKLRNQLGNLLNRVLIILEKDGGIVEFDQQGSSIETAWKSYEQYMSNLDHYNALKVVELLVMEKNTEMENTKPWKLTGKEKVQTLGKLAESLRHISLLLLPFMPETAQKISLQLGVSYAETMLQKDFVIGSKKEWGSQMDWKSIGKPEILFNPIE